MGLVIGVLAGLLVVFLLGYVTVKKPVFGGVLSSISLILVLIVIFFYFQEDKRVENQKQRIPVDQIGISDINHSFAYGNNYKLTANIINNSPRYRLQAVFLQVSFLQCGEDESSPENCQLIEKKLHKVSTRLAPGRSASIEAYIKLDDSVQAQGSVSQRMKNIRWQVKVASGVAR
ncbi:MAG: hypothetical protein QNL62_02325 [Gammaproteobacteria bacterium]|nr:hypothetical protein [Gammaproteobacteria bacterium]